MIVHWTRAKCCELYRIKRSCDVQSQNDLVAFALSEGRKEKGRESLHLMMRRWPWYSVVQEKLEMTKTLLLMLMLMHVTVLVLVLVFVLVLLPKMMMQKMLLLMMLLLLLLLQAKQ